MAAQADLTKAKIDKENIDNAKTKLTSQISTDQANVTAANTKITNLKTAVSQKQAELTAAQQAASEKTTALTEAQTELKNAQAALTSAQITKQDLASREASLTQAKNKQSAALKALTAAKDKQSKAEQAVTTLQKQAEDAKSEAQTAQTALTAAQTETDEANSKLSAAKAKLAKLTSDLQTAKESISGKNLAELQAAAKAAQAEVETAQTALTAAQSDLTEKTAANKAAQANLTSKEAAQSAAQATLKNAQAELAAAEDSASDFNLPTISFTDAQKQATQDLINAALADSNSSDSRYRGKMVMNEFFNPSYRSPAFKAAFDKWADAMTTGLKSTWVDRIQADQNETVDVTNLTDDQAMRLSYFLSYLYNQVRAGLDITKYVGSTQVSKGAVELAKRVAAQSSADNWSEPAHDAYAIQKAMESMGFAGTNVIGDPKKLGDTNQPLESAGFNMPIPTTMAQLKENIVGNVYGMLFNDKQSYMGHTMSLTGISGVDNTNTAANNSTYIGFSSQKLVGKYTGWDYIHFIQVTPFLYIPDNLNNTSDAARLVTEGVTVGKSNPLEDNSAQKTLKAKQAALADAQAKLNNANEALKTAKETASDAAKALNEAQSSADAAQTDFTTKQTAANTANQAVSDFQESSQKVAELITESQTAQADVSDSETSLNAAQTDLATKKAANEAAKLAATAKQIALTNAQTELTQATAATDAASKASQAADSEVNAAQAAVDAIKNPAASIESLQAAVTAATEKVANAQAAVKSANAAINTAETAANNANAALTTAQNDAKKASETLASDQAELAKLANIDQVITDAQAKVAQSQKQVQTAQTTIETAQSDLTNAQAALETAKNNKKQADQELKNAQSALAAAQVVDDTAKKQAQHDKLAGVLTQIKDYQTQMADYLKAVQTANAKLNDILTKLQKLLADGKSAVSAKDSVALTKVQKDASAVDIDGDAEISTIKATLSDAQNLAKKANTVVASLAQNQLFMMLVQTNDLQGEIDSLTNEIETDLASINSQENQLADLAKNATTTEKQVKDVSAQIRALKIETTKATETKAESKSETKQVPTSTSSINTGQVQTSAGKTETEVSANNEKHDVNQSNKDVQNKYVKNVNTKIDFNHKSNQEIGRQVKSNSDKLLMSKDLQKPAVSRAKKNISHNQLPQTGNNVTALTLFGLVLTSLGFILGFKRKKN